MPARDPLSFGGQLKMWLSFDHAFGGASDRAQVTEWAYRNDPTKKARPYPGMVQYLRKLGPNRTGVSLLGASVPAGRGRASRGGWDLAAPIDVAGGVTVVLRHGLELEPAPPDRYAESVMLHTFLASPGHAFNGGVALSMPTAYFQSFSEWHPDNSIRHQALGLGRNVGSQFLHGASLYADGSGALFVEGSAGPFLLSPSSLPSGQLAAFGAPSNGVLVNLLRDLLVFTPALTPTELGDVMLHLGWRASVPAALPPAAPVRGRASTRANLITILRVSLRPARVYGFARAAANLTVLRTHRLSGSASGVATTSSRTVGIMLVAARSRGKATTVANLARLPMRVAGRARGRAVLRAQLQFIYVEFEPLARQVSVTQLIAGTGSERRLVLGQLLPNQTDRVGLGDAVMVSQRVASFAGVRLLRLGVELRGPRAQPPGTRWRLSWGLDGAEHGSRVIRPDLEVVMDDAVIDVSLATYGAHDVFMRLALEAA